MQQGNVLEGFHTIVYVRDGWVEKVYGLKSQPFRLTEAIREILDLKAYNRSLRAVGIKTPKQLDFCLRRHPSHRGLLVIEKAEYIPRTTEAIFRGSDLSEIERVARGMLTSICTTLETGGKVIIDTPVSNFRCNDHTVYYVDLMPPRGLIRGRHLIERPQPKPDMIDFLLSRYCGTLTPILTLNQWCRLRPDLRRTFEMLICQSLADIGNHDIAEHFTSRPGANPRHATLLSLTPFDCDHVRDLACELAYQQKLTTAQLTRVFALAHIDPGGILPSPESIAEAKQILAAVL